ncbi:MAG: coproporphyrinogen III oxidase, partial [Cupriavidus sp.]|nr:coproporphyrinogen III oxidase [Cupriavidus sp.]
MSAPIPDAAGTAFDRRALADFRSLAGRIDGNGPRYTSYPTADRFHNAVGDAGYQTALQACRADSPAPLSL